MSEFIPRSEVKTFHDEALRQFDHLMINEHDAKEAALVAMVRGTNAIFSGEPGGSKSTFALNAYRVIDGISSDDIAHVPPMADISPKELVGGHVTATKETANGRETTTTIIDGIVHEDAKVLYGDEISRLNPHAANSLLGALEERRLITSAGEVALNGLIFAMFTMNPSEHQQGTFKITHAMASRMSVGAELGGNPDSEDEIIDGILGGFKPAPKAMSPVASAADLAAMRVRAERGVAFPTSLHGETKQLIKNMRSTFGESGVKEAPGRMTVQVRDVAQTLAVLNGEEAVQRENVEQAVRLVAGARFAALGTSGRGSAHDVINEMLQK